MTMTSKPLFCVVSLGVHFPLIVLLWRSCAEKDEDGAKRYDGAYYYINMIELLRITTKIARTLPCALNSSGSTRFRPNE